MAREKTTVRNSFRSAVAPSLPFFPPQLPMDTWSLARLRVVLAVALLALVLSLILLSGLADGDYDSAVSSSAVKDFYWIDVSLIFEQRELDLMDFFFLS